MPVSPRYSRPAGAVRIGVVLDPSVKAMLDELAYGRRMSQSALATELMTSAIRQSEKKSEKSE